MPTLTIQPGLRGNQFLVTKTEGSKELYRNTFNPDSLTSRRAVCRDTGISDPDLRGAVVKIRSGVTPVVITLPGDTPGAAGPFTVYLRGKAVLSDLAQGFTGDQPMLALASALVVSDYQGPEPVLYWDQPQRLAALDVDYHHCDYAERPTVIQLENLAAQVQPAPAVYWVTHGRGLRMIFSSAGRFAANELAACAGLSVRRLDPVCTFEIKTETRHPLYLSPEGRECGLIRQQGQTTDMGAVAAWLMREVSTDALETFLEGLGVDPGNKYEHDRCPLRPEVLSHGQPVFIGDHGIVCKKCEAEGIRYGSRRAGFFPWNALMPGGISPMVRIMAEGLAHWDHAQLVIADKLGITGSVAELCYRSLLKIIHCRTFNDPRVEKVFTTGNDLIRLDGHWASADGSRAYANNIPHILGALPACNKVRLNGATGMPEVSTSPEMIERFAQKVDITRYGYPPVMPIRGCRVYSQHLDFDDDSRVSAVMLSGELKPAAMEQYRPRYVKPSARMNPAEARAIYETVFPGLNWEYLRLLCAAKGVAEGRTGMPPMIIATGYTGAAKSTTVHLAAATMGDCNTEVPWNLSSDRFRQAILEGSFKGTFVTVNEILKDAARYGKSPREALDVFLTLTPDSVSHRLYVGPVPLGALPVFVLTEVHLPQEVKDQLQIARRFHHVRLTKRLYWEKPLVNSGVYDPKRFRIAAPEYADAANGLLSDICDTFFHPSRGPLTFDQIARELGFSTLEHDTGYEDPADTLKRFYCAVCEAPPLSDRDAARWPGKGWKIIRKGTETAIADVWRILADNEFSHFTESRRCREQDWSALLGYREGEIIFDIRAHGGETLAVRFRVGGLRSPLARFNGEILDAETIRISGGASAADVGGNDRAAG